MKARSESEVAQSCPTLTQLAEFPMSQKELTLAHNDLETWEDVNPRDGNPPGSPVPGILQARTLEWVAISFSNA